MKRFLVIIALLSLFIIPSSAAYFQSILEQFVPYNVEIKSAVYDENNKTLYLSYVNGLHYSILAPSESLLTSLQHIGVNYSTIKAERSYYHLLLLLLLPIPLFFRRKPKVVRVHEKGHKVVAKALDGTLVSTIQVKLAGRAAEELYYGNDHTFSADALEDLMAATDLVRKYLTYAAGGNAPTAEQVQKAVMCQYKATLKLLK